ncbi:hypothetical protein [Bartonella schoenbuchensis]|uniref:hypothetical protein n=1 Tax=Bartonella schoenbuchensis TaxID=165694 RepID=UPI003144F990
MLGDGDSVRCFVEECLGGEMERVVGDGERDRCVCAVRRKRCKVKGVFGREALGIVWGSANWRGL